MKNELVVKTLDTNTTREWYACPPGSRVIVSYSSAAWGAASIDFGFKKVGVEGFTDFTSGTGLAADGALILDVPTGRVQVEANSIGAATINVSFALFTQGAVSVVHDLPRQRRTGTSP